MNKLKFVKEKLNKTKWFFIKHKKITKIIILGLLITLGYIYLVNITKAKIFNVPLSIYESINNFYLDLLTTKPNTKNIKETIVEKVEKIVSTKNINLKVEEKKLNWNFNIILTVSLATIITLYTTYLTILHFFWDNFKENKLFVFINKIFKVDQELFIDVNKVDKFKEYIRLNDGKLLEAINYLEISKQKGIKLEEMDDIANINLNNEVQKIAEDTDGLNRAYHQEYSCTFETTQQIALNNFLSMTRLQTTTLENIIDKKILFIDLILEDRKATLEKLKGDGLVELYKKDNNQLQLIEDINKTIKDIKGIKTKYSEIKHEIHLTKNNITKRLDMIQISDKDNIKELSINIDTDQNNIIELKTSLLIKKIEEYKQKIKNADQIYKIPENEKELIYHEYRNIRNEININNDESSIEVEYVNEQGVPHEEFTEDVLINMNQSIL